MSSQAPGDPLEDIVHGLRLQEEVDVYNSRHVGREVAAALGMHGQDLVRVTTALSEVTRDVLAAGGGRISFLLVPAAAPAAPRLRVQVQADGLPFAPGTGQDSPGIAAARRLVDAVEVSSQDGHTVVVLEKRLPRAILLAPAERDALRDRLHKVDRSSFDELRTQNRELVDTLEEVQAQRDELETTNQGVMALYSELSEELETTNQGVVALYAEIDDKSRQLREANESKTRFLQNMSHELRTPGNSVLGLARLLLDPTGEPLTAEQRHQVQLVLSSAEDLLRLVNGLLDLAKAESGRLDPVWTDVDLAGLFDELRGTTAPLMTRPAVRLDVGDVGDLSLRTDRTLLRHVLRNLLSNAVKFTECGVVSMTAERDADLVRITVSDTGIGIAEEDQPRVFEEFFQVRGILQSQSVGTGLGLPFARHVSQVLGGDLGVRSTVGTGTTFTVELPVAGPVQQTDRRTDRRTDRTDQTAAG